nr:Stk1 family PASTA domain-containing Ser/Thr kinase [Canibacter oris]
MGRTLDGRYRVRARIARGGMGMVYLADDLRLGRKVAVKAMHPHLVDDENFVRRFGQEAKAAAGLNDQNVVNVFDQGEELGVPYLVMEYIQGETLRDVLKQQKRLTAAQAIEISEAVLKGLAAAHRAGYIHRDLKPENVFLADDGRIKIGDFGLARTADNHTTTSQGLMGTVAYVAPELVTRGAVADARSDIYAFGVMLYEMLTGTQPFRAEQPYQVAIMHTQKDVPRPSDISREATPELDELVRWTTLRDPEKRPKDAAVVLARLHQLLDGGLDAATKVMAPGAGAATTKLPSTTVLRGVDHAAATTHLATTTAAGAGVAGAGTLGASGPAAAAGFSGAGGVAGAGFAGGSGAAAAATPHAAATETNLSENALDRAQYAATKRHKRGLIAAALITVLTLLVTGGAWWFTQGPGAQVAVPDLTGMSLEQAQLTLSEAGLEPHPEQRDCTSPDIPVGAVVEFKPTAATRVEHGTTVQLCLSIGPAQLPVPELVGADTETAKTRIATAGFSFGKIVAERFDAAERGTVLAALDTDHNVLGETYAERAAINLIVSAGPLPEVSGLNAADVASALSAAGLRLDTALNAEEHSDTVPVGKVIRLQQQSETLQVGDAVGLVVSQGPELVTLPNLEGLRMNEAIAQLEELGLVAETGVPGVLRNAVRVNSMSPAAGEQVPKGSTVKLGFEL